MSTELVPYTETDRDELEQMLTEQANKVNLRERAANGMRVILYHLMKENITLIYCQDERTNSAAEFEVPNSEANVWFDHAFAHQDANLEPYQQSQNHE